MLGKELWTRCARAATIGLLGAILGAGAFAGQAALASGSHHHTGYAKSANATKASSKSESASANARLHAAAKEAIEGLVGEGTIDQHQAEVIDGQIDAGSVYPGELVQRGVVTEAQMGAVESALAEVKRSFAPGAKQ
jgi:hypothetical protein